MKNKFIIVGAGRLGSYVANSLSMKGENVIIIDSNKTKLDFLPVTFSGLSFFGDATDASVLEKSSIESAKCIMAFTDDDNINIFIGHIAKEFYDVPSIIVRLNDYDKSQLVVSFGIKTISPFGLSVGQLDKLLKGIK